MKRREFSLSATAVLATGTLSKPALAQARQFR
ncbi:thiol:disulfide interchange protein DsbA/DsbL, partial [Verminephrobacter sp. Larva24]